MSKGTILAIGNQKGGVGKTSTVLHLGFGLGERGFRILMIDLAPQGSLTTYFGSENPDQLTYSGSDLLSKVVHKSDKDATWENTLQSRGALDLLPGNCYLSDAEQLIAAEKFGREIVLKRLIGEVKTKYDFVIIDCSSTLNMLSLNALVAADHLIIPFTPRTLSVQSIGQLLDTVTGIKEVGYNEQIRIVGFLPTMVQKNIKVCQKNIRTVQERYGTEIPIFQSFIPFNNNIEKAMLQCKPVFQFLPNDVASKAYEDFVTEYLQCL